MRAIGRFWVWWYASDSKTSGAWQVHLKIFGRLKILLEENEMLYKFVSFISTLFYICILNYYSWWLKPSYGTTFLLKKNSNFPQSIYVKDFEKPAKEGTRNIDSSQSIFSLSFHSWSRRFPPLPTARELERENINSMPVQCSTGCFKWADDLERGF